MNNDRINVRSDLKCFANLSFVELKMDSIESYFSYQVLFVRLKMFSIHLTSDDNDDNTTEIGAHHAYSTQTAFI